MQPDVRAGTRPATVWIVEDSADYRETVQELVDDSDHFKCAHVFESGEGLFEYLNVPGHFAPDLMIVDIGLPGMSGIEVVQRVRRVAAQTQIVMLTIHEDNERIFEALCAGACGYLLKTARPSQILDALKQARAGGAPMTPQIARRVLNLFTQIRGPSFDYDLTDREKDVLRELIEGKTKAQVGKALFIASHTVDSHMRSLYAKLHVHSRTEAVVKALRERLV